ncbi:MAG: hypothetical protein LBR71_07115 [Synergistaceae bacterium]|nr:hypothetical protein [Synergistaceae bacterium]
MTIDGSDKTALTPERFDYDNLWKTVFHRYFWEALRIFLPSLYEAADRSREPEFLEQELQKITFDLGGGPNRTDLLVKIFLLDESEEIVLCHVEIQGEGGGDLPTRMYSYKQMIFLQYGREPVGIVIITDSRPKHEKTFYRWEQFGAEVLYKYVNVVVMNLEDALLLSGGTQIGFLFYAQKCARKSGNDEGLKFRYLKEISILWAKCGWDPDDKRILLHAVGYLLTLKDEDYLKQFFTHMRVLMESMKEGEKIMYTSMFERFYKEEGRIEGRTEGRAEVARRMLGEGFPVEDVSRYTDLPREEVAKFLN